MSSVEVPNTTEDPEETCMHKCLQNHICSALFIQGHTCSLVSESNKGRIQLKKIIKKKLTRFST